MFLTTWGFRSWRDHQAGQPEMVWCLRTRHHLGYIRVGSQERLRLNFSSPCMGRALKSETNDFNKEMDISSVSWLSRFQFTATYYVWAISTKNIFALCICMTVLHSFSLNLYLHVPILLLMKPFADAQGTLWKRGNYKIPRASHSGGVLEIIERMRLMIDPSTGFIWAMGGSSFLSLS